MADAVGDRRCEGIARRHARTLGRPLGPDPRFGPRTLRACGQAGACGERQEACFAALELLLDELLLEELLESDDVVVVVVDSFLPESDFDESLELDSLLVEVDRLSLR
jgi:hypothetical protein